LCSLVRSTLITVAFPLGFAECTDRLQREQQQTFKISAAAF
jgi:hypothetical protein